MKRLVYNADKIGPWVCERAGGRYRDGVTAVGLVDSDNVLKVGVYYDEYTGSSICMHSRCDDPRAPNREFYRAIFAYPFDQLKVKRITVMVSSTNKRAIRVDEKLGFRLEATIKDYFSDGDCLVYAMYRDDCRWLN